MCREAHDRAPRMPTPPGASSQDTQRTKKDSQPAPNPLHESAFVSDDAPVHDVPMHVIHRPLQSTTDENKVRTFVREMQRGDDFTPIEVLWVQKGDDDFYFAFGGCHRWEAHKRLSRPTIKAKLVKTTPKSLSIYLGRDPFA
ncbi:TPA: Sulfiredoxin [Trebouxia sp. C0006]